MNEIIFDKTFPFDIAAGDRLIILANGTIEIIRHDNTLFVFGSWQREPTVSKVTQRRTRGRGRRK
jgi:hypothetical protein